MGGGGNSGSGGSGNRIKVPPRPKPTPTPLPQQIAVNPSSNPVDITGGAIGGGTGVGAPGGSGGNGSTDLCWIEPFETTVADPQPLAIRKVAVNQELRIAALGSSVWVVNLLGEKCGTIHSHTAKILRCLQQKRQFKAVVVEVNLAELRVEVSNA